MKTYLVSVSLVSVTGSTEIFVQLVNGNSEQEALGILVQHAMKEFPRASLKATLANLITKDMVL